MQGIARAHRRVLVALLGQSVQLGNSIVECLLCKSACLVWAVEDLVIEDGEVECKTEADRVSRGKLDIRDRRGGTVGFEGSFRGAY